MKPHRWHVMLAGLVLAAAVVWIVFRPASGSETSDPSSSGHASGGNSQAAGGGPVHGRPLASPEERWVVDYTRTLVASEEPINFEQLKPVVTKATDDPNPAVRAVAMTSLSRFKKRHVDLLPTLFQGMRDPHPMVRQRAVLALQTLTETRFPAFKPEGSPESRKKAMDFIEAYFRDASATKP